jgi:DNA polymerase-4
MQSSDNDSSHLLIPSIKKIIHVDMDAFYASVEQLDHPEWQGKPLAVGGNELRGVIAAASYEARKYGIYSAMSSVLAVKKCPDLIFAKPRFDRYKEISNQIREIFYEYTDLVEPLSLDEAFLDVSENKVGLKSAILMAKQIRAKIKEKTGLNASAGVSYNKFLAKTASDLNKPNGQAVILPEDAAAFLEKLPIGKFFGIGKVTGEKMKNLGIHNGLDLKQFSLQFLVRKFGKSGLHYFNIVRGIHLSEVQPHRVRKSISAESTFEQDLSTLEELKKGLTPIIEELIRRLEQGGIKGRTVTLKIKFSELSAIHKIAHELLEQDYFPLPIRLIGVGLGNLNTVEEQVFFGEQLKILFKY